MITKFLIERYAQEPLDRMRRFHKKHMGVAWPLMHKAHPVITMTAEKAYLVAALEFLPADLTRFIYDSLE
jgi:hypothetical protein